MNAVRVRKRVEVRLDIEENIRKVFDLRAEAKRIEAELSEAEGVVTDAVAAGYVSHGGLSAVIETRSSIRPSWKDIAVGLGADEEAVRKATPPSISERLVIQPRRS